MAEKKTAGERRNDLEYAISKLEDAALPVSAPQIEKAELEELKYTAPTDEQLFKTAENSLAEYKTSGEKALRENSELAAKELEQKRGSYEENKAAEVAALDEKYNSASRAIDNDVIKRGLARSSVAAVQKAELEAEYLKRNADIVGSYGKKISELDSEIASLGTKLQSALNDFNLSYAIKLRTKIDELTAEREKKTENVIKFNNDVRAKRQTLDESRAKTESTLYSAALERKDKKSLLESLPQDKRFELYRAIYARLDAHLAAMSPDDAREEVYNYAVYRDHLPVSYYYMLFDKYGRD